MEPVSAGALLNVVRTINDLLRRKDVKRKAIFDSVVRPLYESFTEVDGQYIQYFEYAQENLTGNIEALKADLLRMRETYLPLRETLTDFVKIVYEDDDLKEIRSFANQLVDHFFSERFSRSNGAALLEILQGDLDVGEVVGSREARHFVDQVVGKMKRSRRNINSTYVKLRTDLAIPG